MAETIIVNGQHVSRETMVEFKKIYLEAVKKNREHYIWDGQEVLTSYAKYLIEYAENQLGKL